ncbi:sodium:calcium antiporter [Orenia marismortui]|uniref:Cation:H+ antiporter n=1 Tax=Orenia marismortui TaxID=46469 RepID=A0A4V3H029_9FIRM|nr:sodium:calcium antiporter [Orenia marismortui]TDX59149.1 cation:H+ antiporter [Orenia marismortui]
MIGLWSIFLVSAMVIILAGTKLSDYGDIIADKTGLGQALVGGILVAGATSLPELVTSSTAAIIGSPDISIGNVFGSNTFNLTILALVDLIHGPGPFMLRVHSKHILSALLGVLLASVATLFILANHLAGLNIEVLSIGLGSIVILIGYLVGTRLNFRYEKKNKENLKDDDLVDSNISLKKAIIGFSIAAFFIIIAGISLSYSGDKIATLSGLDKTFMGTILVAAATSLPEVVAAIAAIRINAYDMAVGNVFGSNIFNMMIIFTTDLVYRQGSVLADVSLSHSITALMGLVLSGISVIGLFYRSEKTFLTIGWDSIAILITYLFGTYLLFRLGINF